MVKLKILRQFPKSDYSLQIFDGRRLVGRVQTLFQYLENLDSILLIKLKNQVNGRTMELYIVKQLPGLFNSKFQDTFCNVLDHWKLVFFIFILIQIKESLDPPDRCKKNTRVLRYLSQQFLYLNYPFLNQDFLLEQQQNPYAKNQSSLKHSDISLLINIFMIFKLKILKSLQKIDQQLLRVVIFQLEVKRIQFSQKVGQYCHCLRSF